MLVGVKLPVAVIHQSEEAAKERGATVPCWRRAELVSLVEGGGAVEVSPDELAFDVRQALLKAPATKRLDGLAMRTLAEQAWSTWRGPACG